ncbi:MAG: tRNA-intron lyase [Haloarculaceae archaeon]
MDATRSDGAVRAGPAAREQFYDARGYGQPREGDLVLAPVEAAHLLFRGDLATVDGMGFEAFLASGAVLPVTFQVYKDLRDRGFYLSPVGDEPGQVAAAAAPEVATGGPVELEFVVYPRGKGPWDDDVAFWVRAASERANVPAADLVALASTAGGADTSGRGGPAGGDEEGDGDGDGDPQSVLAVVDEEGELTYLGLSRHRPTGATDHDLPTGVEATLLSDRVLVPNPPAALHDRAFYGQRLDREGAALLLSLVEGAFLAESGVLAVEGGAAALRERGRRVEGDRFDRRQAVYGALRTSGVVPKTGFKFGADFRTYAHVEDVADLGHSELLVRVLPCDHVFDPRDVALDVRLAHGVRKEMVFALVSGARNVDWLGVERLTP